VRQGDRVEGFVSHDLYRDLERLGYHLAIGGARGGDSPRDIEAGNALAAASGATGFFRSDRGA
jgi:hypothetical protein